MATYYLRPTSDVTVEHTPSSGSTGYAMIDEATADDDSTYVYFELNNTGSSTQSMTRTSTVVCSATVPEDEEIERVSVLVRAKIGGTVESCTLAATSGGSSAIPSTALTSSYVDYFGSLTSSSLTRAGTTISANLSMQTVLSIAKNKTGNVRITQAYIRIETKKTFGAYIKQRGEWVKKPIYQKVNGSWQLLTSAPSGFSDGDKIVNK